MNLSSGVNNVAGKKFEKTTPNNNTNSAANKRKRSWVPRSRQSVRKMSKGGVNNGMPNPFECILNEIEAFDSTNRKRDFARIKHEEKSEDDSGPCSSKQLLPPTPVPNTTSRPLTKSELVRNEENSNMLRSFLNKDGLMERILGYKMMRGRVETCATICNVIDLDDCVLPEYEDVQEVGNSDGGRRQVPVPFRDLYSDASRTSLHQGSPPPVAQTSASSDKMTATGYYGGAQRPNRGPKTPPGTPPRAANRSRSASLCSSVSSALPRFQIDEEAMASAISEDDEPINTSTPKKPRLDFNKNAHSLFTTCTPLPPPPAFPDFYGSAKKKGFNEKHAKSALKTNNGNANETETLLRQFSDLTQTPMSQLREFIGDDLQAAMSRLDRSVLLSTLKNALKNVTVDTTPPPPVPHNNYQEQRPTKYLLHSSDGDGKAQDASANEGYEMEISSDQSVGVQSGRASSQLLPPPPPPVISPPPPPPPLFGMDLTSSASLNLAMLSQKQHEATAAKVSSSTQVLNTLPTVNLCVPRSSSSTVAPSGLPPPFVANLSVPPPIIGTTSAENVLPPPQKPSMAPPFFTSALPPPPFVPGVTSTANNASGTTSSFVVPPPVVTSITSNTSLSSPQVIRVDLTKKNFSSNSQTPISNANLTTAQPPSTTKIVVNLSAQLKNQGIAVSTPTQNSQRSRPTPTVNMDFIKSRPPPPIPEILRKNLCSSNSTGITTPSLTVATTSSATAVPMMTSMVHPPPISFTGTFPPISQQVDADVTQQQLPVVYPLAKAHPPTKPAPCSTSSTISTVDLTKLVSSQSPSQLLNKGVLAGQTQKLSDLPNAAGTFFTPNVPPPGYNKSSDVISRPNSRLSASIQTSGMSSYTPPATHETLKTPASTSSPLNLQKFVPELGMLQTSSSLASPPFYSTEHPPRTLTLFHSSGHKQPLLPHPGSMPGANSASKNLRMERSPRKLPVPHSNEKNIFKTLISALSTTSAAAALAQALPQYTNSAQQNHSIANSKNTSNKPTTNNLPNMPRPPHHAANIPHAQQNQSSTSMDAILANVIAEGNTMPKFNFSNLSPQDLNASIATFMRALTGANAFNNAPKFAPRNPHFHPPRSSNS